MVIRKVLLGSVAALGIAAGGSNANALMVTWNPGGAVPPLGQPGIGPTGNAFTFTSLAVGDYASITAGPGNTFNENGFLTVTGANLGNQAYVPVGIGGSTATSGPPPQTSGNYTLYFQFQASGNNGAANFNTPGQYAGSFSSLTYTLYGVNGQSSFSVAGGTPTVNNGANTAVVLGMGSLIVGGNQANQTSLSVSSPPAGQNPSPGSAYQIDPTASNLNLSFAPNTAESGFFVTPPSSVSLNFTGGFTNDPSIVTLVSNSQITINGGRGTLTPSVLAVPEPASLALLGSALAGLGLVGFRRKRG